MKALRFSRFGNPGVLSITEVADPQPGSGEVLIRVSAAGINPSDVKNVSGHFKSTVLPRTPGRDFSGVVIAGDALVGERVWGSVPRLGVNRDGTHAEQVIVPMTALARVPRQLSMPQAAAIGVPYTTAWSALVTAAQIQSGETILIIGAAGAVGQAATQIANWKGARVLGAGRGSKPIEGASAVVDTTSGNLRDKVFELTDGHGADVVFDTVGGAMFETALHCLAEGGRQIAISSTTDRRVSFDLIDFYHNQSRLIGVDSMALSFEEAGQIAGELSNGFEAGVLKPPAIQSIPFDQAIDAYQQISDGKTRQKLVLVMEP
jgi:NADPH:quinone reductase-like Zn-dependent oxidoreductase